MDKALYRSVLGYSSYHMDKAMDKALYGPVHSTYTSHLYLFVSTYPGLEPIDEAALEPWQYEPL